MNDALSKHERALRAIPQPYSLALRLRDAGVERSVVSGYVNVDMDSLDLFYYLAEAKLRSALDGTPADTG